jgi:hypothetical protein
MYDEMADKLVVTWNGHFGLEEAVPEELHLHHQPDRYEAYTPAAYDELHFDMSRSDTEKAVGPGMFEDDNNNTFFIFPVRRLSVPACRHFCLGLCCWGSRLFGGVQE